MFHVVKTVTISCSG